MLTLSETGAPSLNRLEILEGRTFAADEHDAFVVDRSFADYQRLHLGDSLAIEVGEKTLGAYPGFRHVRDLDVSLALLDRIGQ